MKQENEEYLTCPIRHVVSRFCDKWSLLALYTINEHGVLRFTELHRHMSDCSQKMLSATLKKSLMPHILGLTGWAKEHFDEVAGQ